MLQIKVTTEVESEFDMYEGIVICPAKSKFKSIVWLNYWYIFLRAELNLGLADWIEWLLIPKA